MRSVTVHLLAFLFTILTVTAFTQSSVDCGHFRTQTQGGWGITASGNNPGAYRDAHFEQAFPQGVSIGCNKTLSFSSSASLAEFLPCGGPALALMESAIDPACIGNVLAGQVLALTLSVGFDAADPSFSGADIPLSSLLIAQGEFEGYTVGEILELANEVLGDCESSFSYSAINQAISSINENFVDGNIDRGFLDCPEEEVEKIYCDLSVSSITSSCISDSTYTVQVSLSGVNGAFTVQSVNAFSGNGQSLCFDSTLTTVTVELVFDLEEDYQFEVFPDGNAPCAIATVNTCAIELNSGTAPNCCTLQVDCPWDDLINLDCLSAIPSASPESIGILESCGEVGIVITEVQSGNGCASSPLLFTRTYTLTDGNESHTCLERYKVIDTEAPVITCPQDETLSCSSGNLFPTVWAVGLDNCDPSVTVFFSDLNTSTCTQISRQWTARDDCNNTATCIQTVSIQDNTPPNMLVPSNKQIDCLASANPNITGQPITNDVCSDVTVSYVDSTETIDACTSKIYRTWTATDECGNSRIGVQIITRADLTGPVISNLPPGTSLQCGDIPPPDEPIAIDACSGDTLTVNREEIIQEDGCQLTIRRIYTAIDACGNATTRLRIITINDTQPPTMDCPGDVTLSCGDTDYAPDVTGTAQATDNCSGTNVTIDFQDGELNMSSCPPEIIRLWSATDDCGNVASCVQHIYFLDTTTPEIVCPADIIISCGDGQTLDPADTGEATGSDDCSQTTVTYTDGPMFGNCPSTFLRTWTVNDACQNSVSCNQTITVYDTIAPVMTCPADISLSCGYGFANPSVAGTPMIEGECLTVTLVYADGPMTGECPKVFTRTWFAADACGNSSSCTQNIFLEDNMVPVVFCPADTSVTCGSDLSPALLGEATAIDYCSSVTVAYGDASFDDGCTSYVERTWTATDACGNSRVCVQTIDLLPDGPVTVDCPSDMTIATFSDAGPEVTGSPIVSSGCSAVEVFYSDVITVTEGENPGNGACGALRTQTQGGWGTVANGGNPGVYRDAHFDLAFPDGLTVGCDYTLTLTSSLAVQNLLPTGGTPAALTSNYTDPMSVGTVFAGQLVALTLSVTFDAVDPEFGASDVALGDMVIAYGSFQGWTVQQVLEEANAVFGSCSSTYSPSQMVQVLSSINENYVGGSMGNGFLECPDGGEEQNGQAIIDRTWTIISACQDTLYCHQVITVEDPDGVTNGTVDLVAYPSPTSGQLMVQTPEAFESNGVLYVYDIKGILIASYPQELNERQLWLDLSTVDPGIYTLLWVGSASTSSTQVVRH